MTKFVFHLSLLHWSFAFVVWCLCLKNVSSMFSSNKCEDGAQWRDNLLRAEKTLLCEDGWAGNGTWQDKYDTVKRSVHWLVSTQVKVIVEGFNPKLKPCCLWVKYLTISGGLPNFFKFSGPSIKLFSERFQHLNIVTVVARQDAEVRVRHLLRRRCSLGPAVLERRRRWRCRRQRARPWVERASSCSGGNDDLVIIPGIAWPLLWRLDRAIDSTFGTADF